MPSPLEWVPAADPVEPRALPGTVTNADVPYDPRYGAPPRSLPRAGWLL
jgi:hypothetical protein